MPLRDALGRSGLESLPLVSLAKREEEVFVLGRSRVGALVRADRPALRMLQQARDEAHRFAVTYNRQRRSIRTVTSELLKIPGIGPAKRRLLLQTFGSVQGVRDATVERIAALPGFSVASAQRLLDSLAPRGERADAEPAAAAAPPAGECNRTPPTYRLTPITKCRAHPTFSPILLPPFPIRDDLDSPLLRLWPRGTECRARRYVPEVRPAVPRRDHVRADRASALRPRWDMWRYADALPLADGEAPVSLGEGFTPLIELAAPGAGSRR